MIADPRLLIPTFLRILDDGREPAILTTLPCADFPTPTYDQLVAEFATGRDSRGRYVRRWVA